MASGMREYESKSALNSANALTSPPSGMSINNTTGVVTWTPSATGIFPVIVRASNGVGTPPTQSFNVVVSADAAPVATLTRPLPGDIVYFGHSHVGIVVAVRGNSLLTIEGNASDAVRHRVYPAWQTVADIDGFGRPWSRRGSPPSERE